MIAEEEDDAATPDDDTVDELYGFMTTEVVGIRHYRGTDLAALLRCILTSSAGLVGPGEEVLLVREAHNPYDKWVHLNVSVCRT